MKGPTLGEIDLPLIVSEIVLALQSPGDMVCSYLLIGLRLFIWKLVRGLLAAFWSSLDPVMFKQHPLVTMVGHGVVLMLNFYGFTWVFLETEDLALGGKLPSWALRLFAWAFILALINYIPQIPSSLTWREHPALMSLVYLGTSSLLLYEPTWFFFGTDILTPRGKLFNWALWRALLIYTLDFHDSYLCREHPLPMFLVSWAVMLLGSVVEFYLLTCFCMDGVLHIGLNLSYLSHGKRRHKYFIFLSGVVIASWMVSRHAT